MVLTIIIVTTQNVMNVNVRPTAENTPTVTLSCADPEIFARGGPGQLDQRGSEKFERGSSFRQNCPDIQAKKQQQQQNCVIHFF